MHVWDEGHHIPESGVTVVLGVVLGLVFAKLMPGEVAAAAVFNQEVFYFVLLPIIIFESGYSLDKAPFRDNFLAINVFAIFGTVISALVIGAIVLLASRSGIGPVLAPEEAFAFASLLSATDPVATLTVFGALGVEPTLNALVYGESVLNDAVGIVLYQTCAKLITAPVTDSAIVSAMITFLTVLFGACLVGLAVGLASASFISVLDTKKLINAEGGLAEQLKCVTKSAVGQAVGATRQVVVATQRAMFHVAGRGIARAHAAAPSVQLSPPRERALSAIGGVFRPQHRSESTMQQWGFHPQHHLESGIPAAAAAAVAERGERSAAQSLPTRHSMFRMPGRGSTLTSPSQSPPPREISSFSSAAAAQPSPRSVAAAAPAHGTGVPKGFREQIAFGAFETSLLLLFAYVSFTAAEALHLSGIVASLVCGIAMKVYTRRVMSWPGKEVSSAVFKLSSSLADSAVFLQIGLNVMLVQKSSGSSLNSVAFFWVTLVACLVGRAATGRPRAHRSALFVRWLGRAPRQQRRPRQPRQSQHNTNQTSSAQDYDYNNYDNLEYAIPTFVKDDDTNQPYLLF
jgi:NhaP-type Na+/H+ or K+/H+ antiporter